MHKTESNLNLIRTSACEVYCFTGKQIGAIAL